MEILDILISFFKDYGYFAVFGILLLCGFGVPVPEDITLTASGIISGLGYTNIHIMFFVAFAGVLLGDTAMFFLGSRLGERVLKWGWIQKVLSPKRYAKIQNSFARYGDGVVFVGRFMPGLRAGVFLIAGLSKKISYARFLMMDGVAAIISVPVWVYLGYYGAHKRHWLMEIVHEGQLGILIVLGILCISVGVVYFVKKRSRH